MLNNKLTDQSEVDLIIKDVILNEGSVKHLECLTDLEKQVFATAFEIDQKWIIEHASTRQEWICQGQSVNLFFPSGTDVNYVNYIHLLAWKKNLKGLYYLRTNAGVTAEKVSNKVDKYEYEECISCQG